VAVTCRGKGRIGNAFGDNCSSALFLTDELPNGHNIAHKMYKKCKQLSKIISYHIFAACCV